MKNLQIVYFCVLLLAGITFGQTTAFKYQGSLTDGGSAATGNFQMQFRMFDSQFGGSQVGATLSDVPVTATAGIFSVSLDFGTNAFGGGPRWLAISVRRSAGEAYTLLSPREQITSSPYAVKTLSASQADALSPACVGCVQNSHISSIDGAKVTGAVANATNATTVASFTGPLAGDVTGNQGSNAVTRLQGRNVAGTAPNNGQVLKFNTANSSWEPANDETATSGGGGTVTGVTAGTGLTGGGTSGSVTLGIQNAGVGTTQLADGSVSTANSPTAQSRHPNSAMAA